ncbi:hypothetical protein R0G64_04820 [Pseudomonas otitidis]|uniref:Uncharacterized protein n=1 Tax=Metapseudomonas otitidis TaxID=319939 RepID=A0ABU3XLP2_9GAMM|nr:hypothetical protein [Pseudomonas otitidis]MDV3438728.1 hypothetical protein [Pseudomonas otitidis]MDV3438755.1 hypothetical protein [Pseudomonas otitidis]
MAQVTNSREIQLGERSVIVREMTVGDVRNWLADVSTAGALVGWVDDGLMGDISLGDLARMTSLKVDEMDAWRPSELQQVIEVARELNPHFFVLRGRMLKAVGTDL